MLKVGLTGGIGSGKSATAVCFSHCGVPVIDTDAIAHELTCSEGEALPAIHTIFGGDIFQPDGSLDRSALRHLIFQDDQARTQLETILHPMIRTHIQRQLHTLNTVYIVIVVPLLIECSWLDIIDCVVVVDCREETQLRRTMRRDGLTENEIHAIMARQARREYRLAYADVVLQNDTDDLDLLCAAVAKLDRRIRDLGTCQP